MVLLVMSVTLALAGQGYNLYVSKTAARRSAEVFAQDLALARGSALRARRRVVVRFDEPARAYEARTEGGHLLFRRNYGPGREVRLDSLELDISGDSMVFDARGILDLGGSRSSLGRASFRAGDSRYEVRFNSMGASRVDEVP